MCIITLTRIFHLTYQYPTLVREITTPSLPGFITSVLNLVSVKSSSEPTRKPKPNTPFLETVLHALVELIPRHPTIFRPFSAQIHSLLVAIVGSSPGLFPKSVADLAQQLFVSLHNCAPKNTSGEEWRNAMELTTSSIHRTLDLVFRAVVEQWESVDPALRQAAKPSDYSQEVGDNGPDPLGLPGWRGIHSGVERLIGLLRLLSEFFSTPTASTVTVPVGSILDLTSRLASVTVPRDDLDASQSSVQLNLQIGREERDSLWAELPRIHVACMHLFHDIVNSLDTGVLPAAQNILEQALWVFRAENFSRELRMSMYDLTRLLLTLMGPSMSKQNVASLNKLFRYCCRDLLQPAGELRPSGNSTDRKANQTTINADSFLNPTLNQNRHGKSSPSFPGLVRAASELLPAILMHVPTEFLSPSIRAEVDRTIILAAEKNAMLASVLNPVPVVGGRGAPSIMPFLVRSHASEMDVEGLVRPRMPVLINTPDVNGVTNAEEEEEEEEEEEASSSMHPDAPESKGFLNTALPAVPSGQPANPKTDKEPDSTSAKRSYTEESAARVPPAGRDERAENLQIKKARVEESVPISSKPSEESSVPFTEGLTSVQETVTATSAPLESTSNVDINSTSMTDIPMARPTVSTGSTLATQAGTMNAATAADESDEELPTLNVDPDSDEEDDVSMDG